MFYENILSLIGNTPIIKLNQIFEDEDIADIYVKLEFLSLGGSVKDRAALGIIEQAEKEGSLKPGGTIIEPTSGNMGISLAIIGKIKGYKTIIVMPDTISIERRNILKALGAELILSDGAESMKGAIAKAESIASKNRNYFMAQQFENLANTETHYRTTGQEILDDVPDLDIFITGVGSGGTISGIGRKLKENIPNVKIIAVEPESSRVIAGGRPGKHQIQGIGAGFIPGNLDLKIIDEVVSVTDTKSFEVGKLIAKKFGLLLGISSGANITAAYEVAKKLGKGKKVLTIAPDSGEKYLSTDLFK